MAVDLGTVDQTLVGLPYVLQTQHVAYRDTLFQDAPNSFAAVLKSPVPYIFPAGTLGVVNRTTLTQYMADGGTLVDENGAAHIDTVALTDVLSFYGDARTAGVIDPALFQLTDPADSWTQYKTRQAGLAAVTSTAYLADRSALRSTGVTWTPTLTGDPYALVTGWSWVITTQDPERQAAALSLVAYLMNPASQGAFTQAAGWLPSQQGALAVWGDSDPYSAFGKELLLHAVLLPDASVRSASGTAIQDALEAVLLNGVSPFQAASEAAQKINPPTAGNP